MRLLHARSLRTVLIAAALVGAVTVPATARPLPAASPTAHKAVGSPTIPSDIGISSTKADKPKNIELAKVKEMAYSLGAKDEEKESEGKVSGTFKYDTKSIRSNGDLEDDGQGVSRVIFNITMADGKTFTRPEGAPGFYEADEDSTSTDWSISGKPKTVTILFFKNWDPDDTTDVEAKQKKYTFKF